eukprot:CAMPEP_0177580924 /NCGR_PEP_ID=MMETSP0419_2-20121207/1850_1 /TAXON_ID=582737 /ORGANISM="Tetraselmis sp., Strain GSL018" /LENGTH=202 /DNA_ID=CAMNT_0019069885 /DNA_START=184 /DNA_END=792 /DNA_ORIENTATION=+
MDGVRICHDPYSPDMASKYGNPGETDVEGFDPYMDTVGPGIYGGRVQRDSTGKIIVGRQYQNHNPFPGPVYAGGGYTDISRALLRGEGSLRALLNEQPELIKEISTGGATPLHICGMNGKAQNWTEFLISLGADVEAVDTYGYRPLHRMASNNLHVGAEALLRAGSDPNALTYSGETPLGIALASEAHGVVKILKAYGAQAS